MYSLVIPVYKNEGSIPDLLETLAQLDGDLDGRLEVIFVVDGSPDRSFELLSERLPRARYASKLLLHSRNYGSFAAIRTGLIAATGSHCAVMAADLQEPPELIREFFRILSTGDVDVVVGTRESRDDPWLSRVASRAFWFLYRRFIVPEIPPGGVDVFGCSRGFRDELLRMEESHSSLIALVFWLGFRRQTVPYRRRPRRHGRSAWTLRRKLTYLSDSLFAFSDLPIKVLLCLGSVGLGVSIIFGLVVLVLRVANVVQVPGYAATITTILFFGALNTIGIGIIGAYVWRAYANTQARPLAVVMRSIEFERRDGPSGDQAAG